MDTDFAQQKQYTHALLDMLSAEKLNAVRSLLEVMVEPLSRSLAAAEVDDEPVTEEEMHEIEASREWFKHNKGIPFEQVVTELGLTMQEIIDHKDPS